MPATFSVILVVIGYISIRHLQNPGVSDGHPVSIAGNILQHLIHPFGWRSGIDHPVPVKAELPGPVVDGETDVLEPSGQQSHESRSELGAHGRNGKEEVIPFTSSEPMPDTGFVYATTGHNAVQMRVVEEIGAPCMEDGRHTGAAPLSSCKGGKRGPRSLEHAVVEDGLMRHGDRVEARRDGEDDMEVLGRDNLLPAAGNPLLSFLVLALRAMSVTAAVVADLHLSALRTDLHVAPKRFCPAKRHVSKGLSDGRDYLMSIEKLSSMLTDNLTDVKFGPHLLAGRVR